MGPGPRTTNLNAYTGSTGIRGGVVKQVAGTINAGPLTQPERIYVANLAKHIRQVPGVGAKNARAALRQYAQQGYVPRDATFNVTYTFKGPRMPSAPRLEQVSAFQRTLEQARIPKKGFITNKKGTMYYFDRTRQQLIQVPKPPTAEAGALDGPPRLPTIRRATRMMAEELDGIGFYAALDDERARA